MASLRMFRRIMSSSVSRKYMTSAALTRLPVKVARPTPATPMSQKSTNTTLSETLTTPAAMRLYMGRLVSPTLRSTAAPKL